jgi:YbbR domain-containing protein
VTTAGGIAAAVSGAFTDNLGLKAVSLACALAIYAFHGADNRQRSFPVGVVSFMPPDGSNRVLLNPLPTTVVATVKGSKTQLDDLHDDDIGTMYLDLHEAAATRVELKPEMVRVPAGLTVVSITPASIDVHWDDLVDRAVPVQVLRTGDAASGLVVKSTTSDPASVVARGPRSEVEKLQVVRSAAFDISTLTAGVHAQRLTLELPPPMVQLEPKSVNASIVIARELKQLQFAKVKIEVVGLPKATVKPSTVEVDLVGPTDAIAAIEASDVVPRVEPRALTDVDTSKPGSAMVNVVVDLPGVEVDVRPKQVLVTW